MNGNEPLIALLSAIRSLGIYEGGPWREYLRHFPQVDLQVPAPPGSSLLSAPDLGSLSCRIVQGAGASPARPDFGISRKMLPLCEMAKKCGPASSCGVVSGCFDLLHLGHIQTICGAKTFLANVPNAILCILVMSDEAIRDKKGLSRPVFNINERISLLCNLDCVDYVSPLQSEDCLEALHLLRPQYFFKTHADHAQPIVEREMDLVRSYGGHVITLAPDGVQMSTTEIIANIRRKCGYGNGDVHDAT